MPRSWRKCCISLPAASPPTINRPPQVGSLMCTLGGTRKAMQKRRRKKKKEEEEEAEEEEEGGEEN